MRAMTTALGLTLILSLGAAAAPLRKPDAVPSAGTQTVKTTIADIERKAERAVHDQQVLDRKFDSLVRKTTASICVGCLTDPALKPAVHTHRARARAQRPD